MCLICWVSVIIILYSWASLYLPGIGLLLFQTGDEIQKQIDYINVLILFDPLNSFRP